VWLAPVQAVIIPIADRHLEYAHAVEARLAAEGIRVEVDDRGERMNAKVRHAQLQKVPYMLIVGDREAEDDAVSVRLRSGDNPGPTPMESTLSMIREAIASRELGDRDFPRLLAKLSYAIFTATPPFNEEKKVGEKA
jgi:threonyl-tRNA synthetase